jgi:hypothetical protein
MNLAARRESSASAITPATGFGPGPNHRGSIHPENPRHAIKTFKNARSLYLALIVLGLVVDSSPAGTTAAAITPRMPSDYAAT